MSKQSNISNFSFGYTNIKENNCADAFDNNITNNTKCSLDKKVSKLSQKSKRAKKSKKVEFLEPNPILNKSNSLTKSNNYLKLSEDNSNNLQNPPIAELDMMTSNAFNFNNIYNIPNPFNSNIKYQKNNSKSSLKLKNKMSLDSTNINNNNINNPNNSITSINSKPHNTKTLIEIIQEIDQKNPAPVKTKDQIREQRKESLLTNTTLKTNTESFLNKKRERSKLLKTRVIVNEKGEIVIQQPDLNEVNEKLNMESSFVPIEEQKEKVTSMSFKKKSETRKWPASDTLLFYKCIECFGTDFSLHELVFNGRSRTQIKNKYLKEEKFNNKALQNSLSKFNKEKLKKIVPLLIEQENRKHICENEEKDKKDGKFTPGYYNRKRLLDKAFNNNNDINNGNGAKANVGSNISKTNIDKEYEDLQNIMKKGSSNQFCTTDIRSVCSSSINNNEDNNNNKNKSKSEENSKMIQILLDNNPVILNQDYIRKPGRRGKSKENSNNINSELLGYYCKTINENENSGSNENISKRKSSMLINDNQNSIQKNSRKRANSSVSNNNINNSNGNINKRKVSENEYGNLMMNKSSDKKNNINNSTLNTNNSNTLGVLTRRNSKTDSFNNNNQNYIPYSTRRRSSVIKGKDKENLILEEFKNNFFN